MNSSNSQLRLKLFGAVCCALVFPLFGLAIGGIIGSLEGGIVWGSLLGLAQYFFIVRKDLYQGRNKGGLIGVLVVVLLFSFYTLWRGGIGMSFAVMMLCYGVALRTMYPLLIQLGAQEQAARQASAGTPEGDKANRKRRTLQVVLGVVLVGFVGIAVYGMFQDESLTPEAVEAIYQEVNPFCTVDNITFAIDSSWTPIEGKDGMFTNEDQTEAYGLNAVSPLGFYTPEDAYEALCQMYDETYGMLNNPVLASFTTNDDVECFTGDIIVALDESTYAHTTVVFVPRKNLMVTFTGQCSMQNSPGSVGAAVQKMMFGVTFQVGESDVVTGNTFIAEDGSELCLETDGSFTYYATAGKHSEQYYTGSYETYYGQAAVDKVSSLSEYGLTAEELESGLQSAMNGYVIGGSTPLDILHAMDPESFPNSSPTYTVCKDTLYAVLLHNEQLVMGPDDVRSGGTTVLYLGYYIPELQLLDMLNCNTSAYHQWTLQTQAALPSASPTT